jgi:hypothetical protein
MATIVKEIATGRRYILLGSGYGAYQSKKPHVLFGDWVAETDEGQFDMVCVCDETGKIGWIKSSYVTVESVDGLPVAQAFGDPQA